MRAGRPSSYTTETAEAICKRLEEGETIKAICASDGMPDWETVRRWLRNREDFRAQYARAREISAEALEMEIIEVSRKAFDKDSAAAARVQVDALKWIAAKRAPKVYGDKLDVSHSLDLTSHLEGMRRRRGGDESGA